MEHTGDINATKDCSMITLIIMSLIMVVVFNSYGGEIIGTNALKEHSENRHVMKGGSVIISSKSSSKLGETYPESMNYD